MSSAITTVSFHGDDLQAVREGDRVWVVLKRACEALGLTDQSQATKLKDKAWATTTMVVAVAEDGKNRELFCLDLDCLPMWLATIDASRVSEEARERLTLYQLECAKALRNYFFAKPSAPAIPTNLRDALLLAADLEGERMRLAAVVEEQAPKVEAHDRFLDTSETFTLTHLAKACGTTGVKMIQWLRDSGHIHKHHKDNPPNAKAIDDGLLVVVNRGYQVVSEDDGTQDRTRPQTRVTTRGMTVLSNEYAVAHPQTALRLLSGGVK